MQDSVGYNTNLAGEFYVLSCLHRRGLDAALTLGNKKGVDILAVRAGKSETDPGEALRIEVKAVAGKSDWFTGPPAVFDRPRLYLVLVSFEGMITDPSKGPRIWVIPGHVAARSIKAFGGKTWGLTRKTVVAAMKSYEHAWDVLLSDGPWVE